MTNTDSEAVTLYPDETQISPNCTLYPILITIRINVKQTEKHLCVLTVSQWNINWPHHCNYIGSGACK